MAPKEFRGIFRPSATKYRTPFSRSAFWKDAFTIQQLLLLGAVGQTLAFALLPARYAFLPAVLLSLHTVLSIALQASSPERNPFLRGVVPGRTSAQFPNSSYRPASSSSSSSSPSFSSSSSPATAEDGPAHDEPAPSPLFGSQPAARPVAVLHLGIVLNHPLGPLAPGARETHAHFLACSAELGRRAREFGCLGQSPWRAAERPANNSLLVVFYFSSLEGLHAFAHDRVHRDAWDWFERFARGGADGSRKKDGDARKRHAHIGVYHEVFVAQPGAYESVYVNTAPTLLGATNIEVRNEATGEAEHVVPLVDADVSALRSQYGRMGKKKAAEPYP